MGVQQDARGEKGEQKELAGQHVARVRLTVPTSRKANGKKKRKREKSRVEEV